MGAGRVARQLAGDLVTTSTTIREELHGTPRGYSLGCRCEPCKAAKSGYAKDRRDAKKAEAIAQRGPSPAQLDAALVAWDAGYARGRRDAMALVLSAAEVQAPAFARQLRSLAQQMEVQR